MSGIVIFCESDIVVFFVMDSTARQLQTNSVSIEAQFSFSYHVVKFIARTFFSKRIVVKAKTYLSGIFVSPTRKKNNLWAAGCPFLLSVFTKTQLEINAKFQICLGFDSEEDVLGIILTRRPKLLLEAASVLRRSIKHDSVSLHQS